MNENVFVIAENTEELRKERWKRIMGLPSNKELVDLHIGPKFPDGDFIITGVSVVEVPKPAETVKVSNLIKESIDVSDWLSTTNLSNSIPSNEHIACIDTEQPSNLVVIDGDRKLNAENLIERLDETLSIRKAKDRIVYIGSGNQLKDKLTIPRIEKGWIEMNPHTVTLGAKVPEKPLPAKWYRYRVSPRDFCRYAMMIRMHRPLPKDFDEWGLCGEAGGRTIAHIAAEYDKLPEDFKQWYLKDSNGVTVEAVYNRMKFDIDNKYGY